MNEDGFFVVLKMRKIKTVRLWTANAVTPVKGWRKTNGDTMEEAMEGQKLQYDSQLAMQKPVPDLADWRQMPMPSGQTVRFLPV